jgi:hypothetical protein
VHPASLHSASPADNQQIFKTKGTKNKKQRERMRKRKRGLLSFDCTAPSFSSFFFFEYEYHLLLPKNEAKKIMKKEESFFVI